jgi:hypothetical protein
MAVNASLLPAAGIFPRAGRAEIRKDIRQANVGWRATPLEAAACCDD